MEEQLRVLVTIGFTLLLVLLRSESDKFGAAEFDEATSEGREPSFQWRIAWYLVGLLLILAADRVHPDAGASLYLRLGDRAEAIVYGLIYGLVGTLLGAAIAWLRYRRFRLPPTDRYPGALLNSVATAFIDEAVFRGLLLAFLVTSGVDAALANVVQAVVYAVATRFGGRGRDAYMILLIVFIGLFSGWLTLITGGIGAAFLGHAITRFAFFLATGHAGRIAPRGAEVEDVERRRNLPPGWQSLEDDDAGSWR